MSTTGTPLPTSVLRQALAEKREQVGYFSPEAERLRAAGVSIPSVACERCPASMWMTKAGQPEIFCGRMGGLVVENGAIRQITSCEGQVAALALWKAAKAQSATR